MDASSKFDDLLLNFGGYPPIWTYAFLGLWSVSQSGKQIN
jgi:hypothetical protein